MHSITQQSHGTITFDNAFRGDDPLFEQALAYHATLALHEAGTHHTGRIGRAVELCRTGSIKVRGIMVERRDGPMRWFEGAALVRDSPEARTADLVTTEMCHRCGASSGDKRWPCAHRYAAALYVAASRTAEQAQYEQAQYKKAQVA